MAARPMAHTAPAQWKCAMSFDNVTAEIAQTAARIVVEEGLEWGPAKQRAVRQLGLPGRTALPDNDQLEEAIREYIELFCGDTQPQELQGYSLFRGREVIQQQPYCVSMHTLTVSSTALG